MVSENFPQDVKNLIHQLEEAEDFSELAKTTGLSKNFLQDVEDLIQKVEKEETDDFLTLVKSAGLDPTKDLAGTDLSGVDLSGADLSSVDLSGTDLSGVDLSGTELSGVDLSGADLSNAILHFANLSGTNLTSAKVENARFRENLGLSEDTKLDLRQRGAIFGIAYHRKEMITETHESLSRPERNHPIIQQRQRLHMLPAFIDSLRIIKASISNPFQEKSLTRYSDLNKTPSEAFPAFSGKNDKEDLRKFNKFLQGQIKILQEKNDKNEKINLSRTYQGIIIFCCILIAFALLGSLISAILFHDPLTKAQDKFLDVCNTLLTTITPALAGLVGGKSIK